MKQNNHDIDMFLKMVNKINSEIKDDNMRDAVKEFVRDIAKCRIEDDRVTYKSESDEELEYPSIKYRLNLDVEKLLKTDVFESCTAVYDYCLN